jgi:arylsulfatase A-like enzyme
MLAGAASIMVGMTHAASLSRRAFFPFLILSPPERRRPNILVVMSDQESALLPGPASLPHRGRLTERGVTFRYAFANTPQCSAARSALLTGLEPHRTGVITNVDAGSLGKPLSPRLPTLGSVLREAGYRTGYFGKWHLGNDERGLAQFGFDTYAPWKSDESTAREAAQWIRSQTEPWLAWVSFVNPHDIYQFPRLMARVEPRPGVRPPASGPESLEGKPSEQREYMERDQGRIALRYGPAEWIRYRTYYLELVEKVDALLGQVLDACPLEGTVAVYTSDHGDALGEHGLPFKGPFMYEPLIRIPLVIASPGGELGRGERTDLVTQADLAPTLAALAGVPWPSPVSGLNLARARDQRREVFLEYYAKQKWVNPIRTIRTRRWKLNRYDRGNVELYDLERDPDEVRNLAAEPSMASLRKQLEERLDAWRKPWLESALRSPAAAATI